jgi:putative RecB family exonuclease
MDTLARLSPTKIGTFRACPQSFAFRYVEGREEPADRFMVRGTLVHEVCERLFDLPATQRSRAMAVALLHRLWERMVDREPELRELFRDAQDAGTWIVSAERLLDAWFRLESPGELSVEGREMFVELAAADGPVLAGIIDRLDRLPDGTWRVTDYKTSSAPAPGWERGGFFQLRFYAMIVAESLGLTVTRLRLVHLGNGGEILELPFDPDGVGTVDRQVSALVATMRQSVESGRWHANVGRRCDWCAFKPCCPAWATGDAAVS